MSDRDRRTSARSKGASACAALLLVAGARAQATADVASWTQWAQANGAHVETIAEGRLLLVAGDRSAPRETLKALESVVRTFDDAFGPALGTHAPAALLELRSADRFDAAMREIARLDPWTQAWAQALAAKPNDFTLETPPVAGVATFVAREAGVATFVAREEWDPVNELVHRATRLLIAQRFGHVPHWLSTGIAWTFEQRVRGSIYCFPGRDEFVSIGEHSGWSTELAALYKSKKSELAFADVCALAPNRFDPPAAARAWGAARFLLENERETLAAALADLGAAWERESRETRPDGTWLRKPNFELSPDEQRAILALHAGKDLFQRMFDAFRDPRRFATPNAKPAEHATNARANGQR